MAGSGPMTAGALAEKTGLEPRYLEEWLAAMATAEYTEYDPSEESYSLSQDHVTVLVGDSPGFQAGRFQIVFSLVAASERVAASFRSGDAVNADSYHPDLWKGIESQSAVSNRNFPVQQWLPALSGGVVDKLHGRGQVWTGRLRQELGG